MTHKIVSSKMVQFLKWWRNQNLFFLGKYVFIAKVRFYFMFKMNFFFLRSTTFYMCVPELYKPYMFNDSLGNKQHKIVTFGWKFSLILSLRIIYFIESQPHENDSTLNRRWPKRVTEVPSGDLTGNLGTL